MESGSVAACPAGVTEALISECKSRLRRLENGATAGVAAGLLRAACCRAVAAAAVEPGFFAPFSLSCCARSFLPTVDAEVACFCLAATARSPCAMRPLERLDEAVAPSVAAGEEKDELAGVVVAGGRGSVRLGGAADVEEAAAESLRNLFSSAFAASGLGGDLKPELPPPEDCLLLSFNTEGGVPGRLLRLLSTGLASKLPPSLSSSIAALSLSARTQTLGSSGCLHRW
jgi:hypothetical protein